MTSKLQPFGVAYDPSIRYSRGWDCPECGWDYSSAERAGYEKATENVVGFTPVPPWTSHSGISTGIYIVECPHDFIRFWFHVASGEGTLNRIRQRIEAANKS